MILFTRRNLFQKLARYTVVIVSIVVSVFAHDARAEEIAAAGLLLQVVESATTTTVSIRAVSNSKNSADAFMLENPSRLVVDLADFQTQSPGRRALNGPLVKGVRFGSHPGKTRLVFDLDDSAKLVASSEHLPLTLTLSHSAGMVVHHADPRPAVSTSSPTTTSTTQPAVRSTTSTTSTTARTTTSTTERTTTTTAQTTSTTLPRNESETIIDATEDFTVGEAALKNREETSPSSTTTLKSAGKNVSVVRSISFRNYGTPPRPAIAIEGANLANYSLKQSGQNSYELTLEGTALAGSHLLLPQFPPDTFSSFEVIQARDNGSGVVIVVYIEEGSKLTPFMAEGILWLKIS